MSSVNLFVIHGDAVIFNRTVSEPPRVDDLLLIGGKTYQVLRFITWNYDASAPGFIENVYARVDHCAGTLHEIAMDTRAIAQGRKVKKE